MEKLYDYLFSKDKLQRCQNHSSVLLMNCRKCFGGCTEGGGFHNNLGSCKLIQKFPVTEILQTVFENMLLVRLRIGLLNNTQKSSSIGKSLLEDALMKI